MANGQFPVTYDVAAEGTRVAHDDIDALIALQELKQPITRGRKAKDAVAFHMPSVATLLEMAFDYPWEGGMYPNRFAGRQILDEVDNPPVAEMLSKGKEVVERLRMGNVPTGVVAYHTPTEIHPGVAASYSGQNWQIPIEENLLQDSQRANLGLPGYMGLPFHSRGTRRGLIKMKDISSVSKGAPVTYDPDLIKIYKQDPTWYTEGHPDNLAMDYLSSIIHESLHGAKRGGAFEHQARKYSDEPSPYSQYNVKLGAYYLGESLRRKLSVKDLSDIVRRMMAGEEIDYSKYKRLDIGGE